MSFLSRLFGSSDNRGGDIESRLAALEAEAQRALPGSKGSPLNRAGDLALSAEDPGRAMALYGRAIDAYLEDQNLDAARGVANKIVRVHPEAVRTLCTLTWLDLAARHMTTALLHLRDYVEASKRSDHGDLAADEIYKMARLVPFPEFLGAAADALDQLDRPDQADEVRHWGTEEGSPDVIRDEYRLAEACSRAATDASASLD